MIEIRETILILQSLLYYNDTKQTFIFPLQHSNQIHARVELPIQTGLKVHCWEVLALEAARVT